MVNAFKYVLTLQGEELFHIFRQLICDNAYDWIVESETKW